MTGVILRFGPVISTAVSGIGFLPFFVGQPHTRLCAFSSWLLSVLASAVSPHHHRLSAVTDLHRFAGKMR